MRSRDIRTALVLALFAFTLLCGPTLVMAQMAEQTAVPASTGLAVTPTQPNATNEWGGSAIIAIYSTMALQWLKRKSWFTIFTEDSTVAIQRTVGILMALAGALGVHASFDREAGSLLITGLTTAGLWTAAIETARQWGIQQVAYRTMYKSGTPSA